MAGDLHTHTTFSDGSLSAHKLVQAAGKKGLTHLAVSDHDSMQSILFGYQPSSYPGLSLIPASELTAFDVQRNRRVHILCYYPEISSALKEFCQTMADRRNAVCHQSLQELLELYPDLTRRWQNNFALIVVFYTKPISFVYCMNLATPMEFTKNCIRNFLAPKVEKCCTIPLMNRWKLYWMSSGKVKGLLFLLIPLCTIVWI